ncbi:MAG TPA: hypothetical protein VMF61_09845 [Candidatus Acidoferrales bacterium]|nr:hypothetical protein [Candidatus Acidoferrales bacterium]
MLTRYLARLLGLWIVLTELGMVATRGSTVAAVGALFSDPALMWVTGVFTMLIGLAIVVAHNRWTEGPVAALVTLYGWAALIKGLLFVWLSQEQQMQFYRALQFDRLFYAYLAIGIVLGAYLLYGGFRRETQA